MGLSLGLQHTALQRVESRDKGQHPANPPSLLTQETTWSFGGGIKASAGTQRKGV